MFELCFEFRDNDHHGTKSTSRMPIRLAFARFSFTRVCSSSFAILTTMLDMRIIFRSRLAFAALGELRKLPSAASGVRFFCRKMESSAAAHFC